MSRRRRAATSPPARVPRSNRSSAGRERRKHRLRRVRDHGEKRPGRPARHALALLPVSDGLDRHAEPGCEFELGAARAAAKFAHRRQRRRLGRCDGSRHRDGDRHRRRERKLLPVPQFDDPSVRFQPQALHALPHLRQVSAMRVKVRLTIRETGPPVYFSSNHSVAMPRNEKKPTTSVMVVTKVPDATAGSARTRSSTIGIRMPPSAPATRLHMIAKPITTPSAGILNQATAAIPVITANARPLTRPTRPSRITTRKALLDPSSRVAKARTATVMVWVAALPPWLATIGASTANATIFSS